MKDFGLSVTDKQRTSAVISCACWVAALALVALSLVSCAPSSVGPGLGIQSPTAVLPTTAALPPTRTPAPTRTSAPTPVPRCFRWDTVSLDDVGHELCIYGRVVSTSAAGGESVVLDFGPAPGGGRGTVMVLYTVAGHVWNEVGYIVGQCLVTSGEVQDLGGYAGVGVTVGGASRTVVRMDGADDTWCDRPVQYYDPTELSS